MKKIGIITFINTINFGASLQAYSLYKTIKRMGYDVKLISYNNSFIENKEKNTERKISMKSIIKKVVMSKGTKRKIRKFADFEKSNIEFSDNYYEDNIKRSNEEFDTFVTGSDQVWNLKITNSDWNYFLSFVNKDKTKISYAASFGNNVIEKKDYKSIKKNLKDFSGISVREESGQKFLEKNCEIKSKVVLDPTFLINKEEWEKLSDFKPNIDKYILVYFPHNKDKVFKFAKKLSKEKKLPIVYLSISPKIIFNVKTVYDASPEEFVGWIKNAEYIVTGSFHGTAFSINLEKQFYYEPSGDGSRIDNLVKMTDTYDRSIDLIKDFDIKIDYEKSKKILENKKKESLDFLKNALD